MIHNYRWRLGLAAGESQYDELERRLADGPAIAVPTITLEGDANGAPHPDASAYAQKFSGKYVHRVIEGGGGHNLPQEAPKNSPRPSSTPTISDRHNIAATGLPDAPTAADTGRQPQNWSRGQSARCWPPTPRLPHSGRRNASAR